MSGGKYGHVIRYARTHLGKGESGKNNSGPYVEMVGRGRTGNWCATSLSYWLEESGATMQIPDRFRRGAKGLAKYCARELGSWVVKPRWLRSPVHLREPQAGDVIAWHLIPGDKGRRLWRGHVELVAGYDPQTDTIKTIAGNVGPFPAVVRTRTHMAGRWRRKLFGVARLD